MITLRPAHARGHAHHGWLDSWHSFSFADYFDPDEMGWGSLRVINDDRIAAGAGFPMHGHRDMEIVTWLLEGELEHRDSLGNGSVIRPGEIQRMSAGRGIRHSEFNPSRQQPTHLLQIWIEPSAVGIAPGYEQQAVPLGETQGRLRLIASPDGRDGSVTIHQDTAILVARLSAGETIGHTLVPGRIAYLHVARGEVTLNGQPMQAGDGAKIRGETALTLSGRQAAEVLLFDMAEH